MCKIPGAAGMPFGKENVVPDEGEEADRSDQCWVFSSVFTNVGLVLRMIENL